MLNGFTGIGKSTIAERYIDDNPLTMNIEGDRLIVMIGQWARHEPKARELVYELSKGMAAACLDQGHDVIVPYLPTTSERLEGFEQVAKEHGGRFIEILLTCSRQEAVERLMRRGTWGEEGTGVITVADMPIIEGLLDSMEISLAARPNIIKVASVEHDHDGTYQRFLEAIK